MNIISSNCLGGFIYKDVLNSDYKNPFIWTRFEFDTFVDFINHYEEINFNNVMIDRIGNTLSNNFTTIIDDKYTLKNRHICFSKQYTKPTVKREGFVMVYYNKPWEYILEKYNSRVKRMLELNERPIIVYYDPDHKITKENLEKLSKVFEDKNYKCLIFTDKTIIPSMTTTVINFKHKKEPWHLELINKHKETILNFLYAV